MTGLETHIVNAAAAVRIDGKGSAATVAAAVEWLRLAATPTFAAMALLTGPTTGQADYLCPAGPAAPLSGMAVMYLLMSVFHLPPWLKLAFRRRGAAA